MKSDSTPPSVRHEPLKFAIIGAGFWSQYQLAAWQELQGVECVAIYNRTRSKAEALAGRFGVRCVYDDPEAMLRETQLDFLDIITDVGTHPQFVKLAAAHRIPAICQKPMAPTLAEAVAMTEACHMTGIPFFIHENWRWQTPIREIHRAMKTGVIGEPFRARIDFITGFPVFKNQPFLAELEQFILTDIGSHILDVARFLFGEARSLYCQTRRIHTTIKGEDVATVMMEMGAGTSVVCQMAYAENYLEHDRFPETCIFVEGTQGSLELGPDYWVQVTSKEGTQSRRCPPPRYMWADPAYDVVQSSIVACNANLLGALRGENKAETSAADNSKTVQLVFGAYESSAKDKVIHL